MLVLATALALCSTGPRIDCVVDGDTRWEQGIKLREEGYDTPETDHAKCPAERALGIRARDRYLELLNAAPYETRFTGKLDRHKRPLVVTVNGYGPIGDQLTAEGLARKWTGRREPWC